MCKQILYIIPPTGSPRILISAVPSDIRNSADARKVAPEKWKTVIRHPIKKA